MRRSRRPACCRSRRRSSRSSCPGQLRWSACRRTRSALHPRHRKTAARTSHSRACRRSRLGWFRNFFRPARRWWACNRTHSASHRRRSCRAPCSCRNRARERSHRGAARNSSPTTRNCRACTGPKGNGRRSAVCCSWSLRSRTGSHRSAGGCTRVEAHCSSSPSCIARCTRGSTRLPMGNLPNSVQRMSRERRSCWQASAERIHRAASARCPVPSSRSCRPPPPPTPRLLGAESGCSR